MPSCMLYAVLIILAFVVLTFSTITDIRKREVPDFVSYSFILGAIFLRLLYAILFKEPLLFWYGIFGFGAMFLFGYLMYITKQWGGGDAKLLMGLGAAFATFPEYNPFIFLILLLINIFFFGALYGLAYGCVLAVRKWELFQRHFLMGLFSKKSKKVRIMYGVASLITISLLFFIDDSFLRVFLLLVALFLFMYPLLLVAMKSVEHVSMLKERKPVELTEGDWVAQEVIVHGKRICGPSDIGLTKEQIRELIKKHVKGVIIKEGMPFVPPFFIGFVFTLLFGPLSSLFL